VDAKKYLIAVLVVFVVHSGIGYALHGGFLADDYQSLTIVRGLYDFVQRLPLLYLGNLLFALMLCFLYTRGYTPRQPWFPQGLVCGLLLSTLLVPAALAVYVVLPVPGWLTCKIILLNYLHITASCLTAAVIYRFPPPPLPE